MNAPKKLRAGTGSQLTKFKELWLRLAGIDRSYWRNRFVSPEVSQAQIRQEILDKYKINLKRDSQLNDFRNWVACQDTLDDEAKQLEENLRSVLDQNPDWTKEKARDFLLMKAMMHSVAYQDFDLGLKAIALDTRVRYRRHKP